MDNFFFQKTKRYLEEENNQPKRVIAPKMIDEAG
jgi:hypothetical protein